MISPSRQIEPPSPSPRWNRSVLLSWWLPPCCCALRGTVFERWACQPSFVPSCEVSRSEKRSAEAISEVHRFRLGSGITTHRSKRVLNTCRSSEHDHTRIGKREHGVHNSRLTLRGSVLLPFVFFCPLWITALKEMTSGKWRWFGQSAAKRFRCLRCWIWIYEEWNKRSCRWDRSFKVHSFLYHL